MVIFLIRRKFDDPAPLIRIFLVALLARLLFGTVVHVFELRTFFGGDALTYDALAVQINDVWFGRAFANDPDSILAMSTGTPGWGMNYLTAFVYLILGRNILAAQFFCAVIGAATAPLVYLCALKIFNNQRVGRVAAILVALSPAFIIWSGQLLKDGLIIFLLVATMTIVVHLQEKFSYLAVFALLASVFGILALRFYIFYMVAVSVAGSFVLGQTTSGKSLARGFALLVVTGIALTYLGVVRTATENFEKFGSLEAVQRSRSDLARSADSGFGEDLDVSTTQGALTALPVGVVYLMLAPFPWQVSNLRQAITVPEVLIWWVSIPFMFFGIGYTVRHKLRKALPILIFTLLLTLAYSIFQGNVGTAYRQRTQIQVFMFIFVAVGVTIRLEKRENQQVIERERRLAVQKRLQRLSPADR
jgi:4-amino-4-deoxy-L-arabinose transferase-like glycosyltransferase